MERSWKIRRRQINTKFGRHDPPKHPGESRERSGGSEESLARGAIGIFFSRAKMEILGFRTRTSMI
jgi:hypothetical protein